MARPRPTEVKAIVALLEGEAEDVEELAVRVIQTLDEARADRPGFIVVKAHQGQLTYAYGPWATRLQAEKGLAKGLAIEGESYGICKLWSPLHAEKAQEAADAPVRLADVPHKHPVPYGPDETAKRRRYQNMTEAQKRQEFERRAS